LNAFSPIAELSREQKAAYPLNPKTTCGALTSAGQISDREKALCPGAPPQKRNFVHSPMKWKNNCRTATKFF